MRNIKLVIEYDGTHYSGWQKQPHRHVKTIQGTIEKVLQTILGKKIKLIGAGRTDAGVHAKAQVAHFQAETTIAADNLRSALNSLLPEDIVIREVRDVPDSFHARYSAKSKIYRYSIINRLYPAALLRKYYLHVDMPLDIDAMRSGACYMTGKHDFSCFCASGSSRKKPVITIRDIQFKTRKDIIFIDIEAESFLYKMVRNIVGTLLEVGRGRIAPGYIRDILSRKNRKFAGPTAPAHGLCLIKVKYL